MLSKPPSITIKSSNEIALMIKAGKILAKVLEELSKFCQPGITTDEINTQADYLIRTQGALPGFFGYNGFPKSICISVNNEVVHGIPGPRIIQDGDLVSLDCGAVYEGLWADSGLTVGVGEVSVEARKLLVITQQALYAGIRAARAGNRIGDISASIQSYVEKSGFSVVRDLVGHGIGRAMHEPPQVPNFGQINTGPILKEGYGLAIEPMVNQGTHKVKTLKDGWTVVTEDGKLSAYFEHTVLVTEGEPIVTTLRNDEIL
jgi:methionyl aminopeptidase